MMTRRKVLGMLAGTALFSGCGTSTRSSRQEVTFCGFGNPQEVEALLAVFTLFEQANPDLRVRFIHIPQSYDSVLVTMIAGHKAPDVFYVGPWTLGSLLAKKALLPIDQYLHTSTLLKIEDFYPETVNPYRFDGRTFGSGPLYGLCKDWSPDYLLFYNERLFHVAGLPLPDGNWGQEAFAEAAQRLTVRDEKGHITQFGVFNNCIAEQWVRQAGGRFFSEDGSRCDISSEACVRGLSYSADLSLRWKAAPGYGEQAQQNFPNVLFEVGRTAMCFSGMWMVHGLRAKMPHHEWSVTLPPHGQQEEYLSTGMIGYGISSSTPRPEAAWRLFEFLLSPAVQGNFARLGWNIPSNRAVARGPDFLGNADLDHKIVGTFLEAAEKTVLFQRSPFIEPETFYGLFKPAWDSVLLARRDVASALAQVARQVDETIIRNRNAGA